MVSVLYIPEAGPPNKKLLLTALCLALESPTPGCSTEALFLGLIPNPVDAITFQPAAEGWTRWEGTGTEGAGPLGPERQDLGQRSQSGPCPASTCCGFGEWVSSWEDPAPRPQCNERFLSPSHTRSILPKLLRLLESNPAVERHSCDKAWVPMAPSPGGKGRDRPKDGDTVGGTWCWHCDSRSGYV